MRPEHWFNGVSTLAQARGALTLSDHRLVLRPIYRRSSRALVEPDELVFVYTMAAGEMGVKIGLSSDPERRASQLRSRRGVPHRLICTDEFYRRGDAFAAERQAHRDLAPFLNRRCGSPEYFTAPVEVVSFWVSAVCAAMAADWYSEEGAL